VAILFPVRRGRRLARPDCERADGQQPNAHGVDRGIPPAKEAERADYWEDAEKAGSEARLPSQRLEADNTNYRSCRLLRSSEGEVAIIGGMGCSRQ